jgi:hypothetical protein
VKDIGKMPGAVCAVVIGIGKSGGPRCQLKKDSLNETFRSGMCAGAPGSTSGILLKGIKLTGNKRKFFLVGGEFVAACRTDALF